MSDSIGDTEAGERKLVTVRSRPFNAETPLVALREPLTPTENIYVRSNFSFPDLQSDSWHLRVDGAVARPLELSLNDLMAMPSRTITSTMECAGNGRLGFAPLPRGEPWALGAVSTAIWEGASLADLLREAGLASSAIEVLFEGADRGVVSEINADISFARSLPIAKSLQIDTLLAYRLNGQLLPPEHGAPLRLVVPDWYGMASVKWLVRITALEQPFTGYYQAQRYILDWSDGADYVPVQTMGVRSIITSIAPGDVLPPGRHVISGVAWSGEGAITEVRVSTGSDEPWQTARLTGPALPHAWRQWEYDWDASRAGRHALRSMATDEHGNVQPDPARWNRLGYCNNSVQTVSVEVRDGLGVRDQGSGDDGQLIATGNEQRITNN